MGMGNTPVTATRMPALAAKVMVACSTNGVSTASSNSLNLITQAPASVCSKAFGRAPPSVTPGCIRRCMSAVTGAWVCRSSIAALKGTRSRSCGYGPNWRGTY